MAEPIKIEGGDKVPSRSKKEQQKKALNLEIKKEDDETINKAVAAMSGRRYTKRTKAQIIKDRAPRVYKDIREQD